MKKWSPRGCEDVFASVCLSTSAHLKAMAERLINSAELLTSQGNTRTILELVQEGCTLASSLGFPGDPDGSSQESG